MSFSLAVKHNIEVAHRLSKLPGKCEAIHGHSMWVTLEIFSQNQLDENELLDGLNFTDVKKQFRSFLDKEFDHRLLLNAEDIWAQPIYRVAPKEMDLEEAGLHGTATFLVPTGDSQQEWLPGLRVMQGDPSTENIAKEIGKWAQSNLGIEHTFDVTVWETSVNMARYRA